MTFWLDAQLDPDLSDWLGATFKIVVKTLRECGLPNASDDELFQAGRRFEGIVIVTKDKDFVELIRRHGSPPQVVWLRLPNMATIKMRSLLSMTFSETVRLLEAGAAIIEILESGRCSELKLNPKS